MEKHSMLMGRKKQYHENGHTAQSNLQIPCYPHQATIDFLHITRKNHYELPTYAGYLYFKAFVKSAYYLLVLSIKMKAVLHTK